MLPHLMQLNSVMQAIVAGGVVMPEWSMYGDKYDMYEVRQALQDRGYNVLGRGHFSVVVSTLESEMRNTVIKIGGCVGDAWLAFAVFAMNNPAPWLPVIHSIHMNKTFYIVEMEKLSSVKASLPDATAFIHNLRTRCVQENPAALGAYVSNSDAIRWHLRGETMINMQHALGQINDLHGENYMWRDDQLVLTDPYSRTDAKLPKAPEDAWATVEVMHEDYRAELCAIVEELTPRREEEVQPLREQSVDDFAQQLEQGMGLLPQVRKDFFHWQVFPHKFRRLTEVRAARLNPEDDKRPFRYRTGVRGFRADKFIVDDVAAQGWHIGAAEKHLQAWLEQEAGAGRVARVHDEFIINRDLGPKSPAPEPAAEVYNGQPIPEYGRIPQQARKGKLDEDGRAKPAVRSGFRRGRLIMHKSRRVCTDRELARDGAWIGKIRQDNIDRYEAKREAAALWAMARPGQGRAEGQPEAPKKLKFNGLRVLDYFIA
ncbi:putative protein kinase protein [Rhizobium phage RHph_I40]|uniref:Uncharacterized protein n=1 Tax=Rhizobium phage RHph_I38 TaxID=2509734 RepID=A0A7S5R8X8_9CAUD|nr:putative protein kinase protein [Rhizobium phage RHph_I38]QXV73642.1 putative protein kinase protein [Rhizobium phage RHph_I40]